MKLIKKYGTLTLGAICVLLVGACGGGSSNGLAYTGPTTSATITATNGKEIATSAYLNGEGPATLSTLFASATELKASANSGTPRITTLTLALIKVINKIDLTTTETTVRSRAVQNANQTFTSTCGNGGPAKLTLSIDDVTGNFSGSYSFNNYCDAGVTMNGGMSMSGNINLNTLIFGNMTMTFSTLTITIGGDSLTTDGSISVNPGVSPIIATTNIKMKDNRSNKTFWAEQFITSLNIGIGYDELSISGRLYHPDYGYVDLATPTPFYIATADEWPSSGVMIATGDKASKVKLTAISNTTYNYEIDADGDYVYEVQQLNQLWANP